jgi:DNA-directed RNA polymerase specialized sigma24 family protein
MLSEEDLIDQCLKKNRKAQATLYNRYAPKMYGICLRFAKNKMAAEDILQEGFIKVFNNLEISGRKDLLKDG